MSIKLPREKSFWIVSISSYVIAFVLGFYSSKIGRNSEGNIHHLETKSERNFRQIGVEFGTDKVTIHGYDRIYEKYLRKYLDKNVSLLEIGLGCGMTYGAGASAHVWRKYFGSLAKIHFIEYDEKCGRKWFDTYGNKLNVTISYGSQADVTFLKKFIAETNDSFDIIVDDGGHTMKQQITSLIYLIEKVRSGGLYVIEDLQTSYSQHPPDGYYEKNLTTLELIQQLVNEIQNVFPRKIWKFAERIFSFEISNQICVLNLR